MAKRLISSESYTIPVILAVIVHVLVLGGFFIGWSSHADIPVAKPTMVATLYEVTSKSPATTQTDAKLAGKAEKTKAPLSKEDQAATQREEQRKIAEQQAKAKAAEKKKVEEKAKLEAKKKADEETRIALANKQKQEKAKAEAKKKAAEKAKADKLKADKERAEAEAKKKAAADAKAKADAVARKAQEDREAAALADLLGDKVEHGATKGDEIGSKVVGSIDDLIKQLVKDNWTEMGNPVPGTSVELMISMLPDGTITNVIVSRGSGNKAFDNSAMNAARNIGKIREVQKLDLNTFNQNYRQKKFIFETKGF